ncbi:MAG: hypothetical protein U0694_02185 [Anaerolineae bacterium]
MMDSTISIQQALLAQVETLAQRLNLTPQEVVERALAQFCGSRMCRTVRRLSG